ncbi:hypothetical protein [Evansella cellulosilytica]|uniref:Uncharacterized protein n=1 Tax=Evansella cellulosilytica (strain ATCC 21833 / DSM 2522 / FERM P-1141 / JCM 9156 / N-4) TaxID=649639 RepID=E6TXZ1_EVAC2|nr:hypothetical protein [Evansella cellulosilytica]ADU31204.1 hypothetical protein Bcell_2953 [Evansella cellulosilytica DSM 2522]
MKESCFQAEFQDVFIELPRPALKSFIHKLLQAQFRISWRHENKDVELVIKSKEGEVTIPIKRPNEHLTVIQLHELSICMEDLAILLEELITETKGRAIVKTASGGWIYVSCFDKGKIVSVMKIGGGEKAEMGSYRTINKNRNPMEEIDPEVKEYMLTAEIDYLLMELVEALENEDGNEVQTIKKELRYLSEEREKLKHYVKRTASRN